MKTQYLIILLLLGLQFPLYSQSAEEVLTKGFELIRIDPDSAIVVVTEGLELARADNDTLMEAQGELYLARSIMYTYDFSGALNHFRESKRIYTMLGDSAGVYRCISRMAICYNQLKMYDEALIYYFKALTRYETGSDSVNQLDAAAAMTNIATLYSNLGEDSTALTYYYQALGKARKIGNRNLEGRVASLLGVSMLTVSIDSAMSYFQIARSLLTENTDLRNLATIEIHLGDYYSERNLFDTAISYYSKALAIAEEGKIGITQAEVLIKMGQAEKGAGRLREALKNVLEGVKIADVEDLTSLQMSGYDELHQLYSQEGRMREAYQAVLKRNAFSDTLNNRAKLLEIGRIEGAHQVQLSQEKIDRQSETIGFLESEKKSSATILRLSVIAAILLGLMVLGLLLYLRDRKRKNAKILEKEKELADSLRQNLDYRKQEIGDLVAMVTFKNEVIEKSEVGFQKLLEESELAAIRRQTKSIMLDIKQLAVDSPETNRLIAISETTQREFHEKLNEINQLTPRELKLCALIRLGLSIKEIAIALGSTEKAVEMAKYRLKKKLQLTVDDDLNQFVSEL